MKKLIFLSALCFILFSVKLHAQENQIADWIRVQSDNGEFSIELPKTAGYFYDNDGFRISENSSSYEMKKMNLFNAFQEHTFLSVETYQTSNPKAVAEILQEREKKLGESSEIKHDNFRIKQILIRDQSLTIRQFFFSKKYVYILTAASRNGETETMKHFLSSAMFDPDAKNIAGQQAKASNSPVYLFSKIKPYAVEFDMNPPSTNTAAQPSLPSSPKDDSVLPFTILSKPRSAYTDAARQAAEQGVIRLRVTFAENGRITKLVVLKSLRFGLLREAVFSALRIKFLPPEKNGNPISVTKVIEYSFAIY